MNPAAGMDTIGDMSQGVKAKGMEEQLKIRKKRGQCVTCGVQTHTVSVFGKRTPLTKYGHVENGRCLTCEPLTGTSSQPIQVKAENNSRKSLFNSSSRYSSSNKASLSQQSGSLSEGLSSINLKDSSRENDPPSLGRNNHQLRGRQDSLNRSNNNGSRAGRIQSRASAPVDVSSRERNVNFQSNLSVQSAPSSSSDTYERASTGRDGDRLHDRRVNSWANSSQANRRAVEQQGGASLTTPRHRVSNSLGSNPLGSRISRVSHRSSRSEGNLDYTANEPSIQRRKTTATQDSTIDEQTVVDPERELREIMDTNDQGSFQKVVKLMDEHRNSKGFLKDCAAYLADSFEEQVQLLLSMNQSKEGLIENSVKVITDILFKNLPDSDLQYSLINVFFTVTWQEEGKIAVGMLATEVLYQSLIQHSDNVVVLNMIASVFSHVCTNQVALAEVRKFDVIHHLLKAVNRFMDDTNEKAEYLKLRSIHAVSNIMFQSEGHMNMFVEKEGLSIVLQTVNRHMSQEAFCDVVCNCVLILVSNDDDVKHLFYQEGGIEIFVQIMNTHGTSADIVKHSVKILSNVAMVCEDKARFQTSSALELIIKAMGDFVGNTEVSEWGLMGLWTLSVDAENKNSIALLGGFDIIMDVMEEHVTSASISEKACGALAAICTNSVDNKISLVEHEGGEIILNTMRFHESDELVQCRACLAFKKLLCNETLPILQCLDLIPVLEKAASKFLECKNDADHAISILQNTE